MEIKNWQVVSQTTNEVVFDNLTRQEAADKAAIFHTPENPLYLQCVADPIQ